jgi:hypothetical protein
MKRKVHMMKALGPLIAIGLLAGCQGAFSGPPEVAQCEKYIRAKLEKPDSFQRIESASLALPFPKATYWEVGMDYSFVSGSGTPAHGSQLCDFPLVGGKADTSHYIDFDNNNAKLKGR